ncbi:MAG: hypothetical protein WCP93_00605 [Candidatus Berkelbacteria bacterium]
MSEEIGGPYFRGQEPCHCGHYYPDVLRIKESLGDGGTVVYEYDCCICKTTYTVRMPGVFSYSTKSPKPMDHVEMHDYRKAERRRLRSK